MEPTVIDANIVRVIIARKEPRSRLTQFPPVHTGEPIKLYRDDAASTSPVEFPHNRPTLYECRTTDAVKRVADKCCGTGK